MSANSSEETIRRLREIASAHMLEIDNDKLAEAKAELQKKSDLERYSRHHKPSSRSGAAPATEASKPRMRTAEDVLDRLKWDKSMDLRKYKVGYLERFEGIKEMAAAYWIDDTTDEDWIPQHRIKYFKHLCGPGQDDWVIVWDRERRIDHIFGSGLSSSGPTMEAT